ncbi:MAG: DNA adenine methylase, partial [Marinirhabdus sp.]
MDHLLEEPVVTYNQFNLSFTNYTRARKLEPLVKWAGGKERELKYIIPNLPGYFEDYYEPFVGGGSVYTAIQARRYFINDKSHELIALYRTIVSGQRAVFFKAINGIVENWAVLGGISVKNQAFFVKMYNEFANGKTPKDRLLDGIDRFILKNSVQLKGLFSPYFNLNIENFLKEVKKNLVRKVLRMKVLER